MLNNFKHLLIGILSAVIVVAVGASAYTALASPGADQPAAPGTSADFGKGNGNGSGISALNLPAGELSTGFCKCVPN